MPITVNTQHLNHVKNKGKRLLIVEDDLSLRRMLSWEFDDLGYSVCARACCAEATAAVENQQFDMALLDYNLPDGVGLDLLKLIRRRNPGLPVILYSGKVSESTFGQTLLFENVRFIAKPVTAETLHGLFLLLNLGEK